MELFTLGVGHYSETDVREAARALTGWRVDRAHAAAAPVPQAARRRQQDLLGVTGDLDDRSLVDLLTARPESAAFVATRLWARLGSATLPADTLRRLVAAYGPGAGRDRAAAGDAPGPGVPGRQVVAGRVAGRVRRGRLPGAERRRPARRPGRPALLGTLDALGQVPFRPPSVGGWPAAIAWLSTAATKERLTSPAAVARKADLDAVARRHGPARGGRVPARRRRLDRPHAGRAQGRGRRPRRGWSPSPWSAPNTWSAERRSTMDVDTLTRRRFLLASGVTGAAALAAGAGTVGWREIAGRAPADPLPADANVLVLVTLYGGNDGLNTVVPSADAPTTPPGPSSRTGRRRCSSSTSVSA